MISPKGPLNQSTVVGAESGGGRITMVVTMLVLVIGIFESLVNRRGAIMRNAASLRAVFIHP
jgi:hypothetical protein